MTNAERIKANNVDLQKCIDLAESLPDADTPSEEYEVYEGSYEIVPSVAEQKLPTKEKVLVEDMTIKSIPFFDTSNTSGGITVYIGSEI